MQGRRLLDPQLGLGELGAGAVSGEQPRWGHRAAEGRRNAATQCCSPAGVSAGARSPLLCL